MLPLPCVVPGCASPYLTHAASRAVLFKYRFRVAQVKGRQSKGGQSQNQGGQIKGGSNGIDAFWGLNASQPSQDVAEL